MSSFSRARKEEERGERETRKRRRTIRNLLDLLNDRSRDDHWLLEMLGSLQRVFPVREIKSSATAPILNVAKEDFAENLQGRQILLRETIPLVSPIVQPQTVQVIALHSPQPTLTVLRRSETRSQHLTRRRGRRESIESRDGSRGVLSTKVGDVDSDVGRRRTGGGGRRC